MKIEKVNDNQIRCTLTREDLASRQIKISELAYGTEKAKSLFRDMMQQAHFQFGFEAEDIPLMIEAIPLNAECIVLIITKVEDPEELDTRFSRFAPSMQDGGDGSIPELTSHADELMDLFRRLQEKKAAAVNSPAEGTPPAEEELPSRLTRIFLFDSLRILMDAARIMAPHFSGSSSLYKDEVAEKYLLTLSQEDMSLEDYNRVCNILSEYGTILRTLPASHSYLEEHYSPMIAGHALSSLAQIQ